MVLRCNCIFAPDWSGWLLVIVGIDRLSDFVDFVFAIEEPFFFFFFLFCLLVATVRGYLPFIYVCFLVTEVATKNYWRQCGIISGLKVTALLVCICVARSGLLSRVLMMKNR